MRVPPAPSQVSLSQEIHFQKGWAKVLADKYRDWYEEDIVFWRQRHRDINRFFAVYEPLRMRAHQGSPNDPETERAIWPEFHTWGHPDDLGKDPFAACVQPIVNLVRNLVVGFVERCAKARAVVGDRERG